MTERGTSVPLALLFLVLARGPAAQAQALPVRHWDLTGLRSIGNKRRRGLPPR